jgi:histidinol-phosphate phosphatase family protein
MKKCVFFDRDGVVNKSPGAGYVERWADFEFLPDFASVLKTVKRLGYEAVVVTNQRGVSRGIMTLEALEEIHRNLVQLLKEEYGLALLDIMVCTHGKDECECRKPKPGMLIKAAKRHNLDLKASWMVGDQEKDIEAGRRAGCRTILLCGQKTETKADHIVPDLKALESLLERVLHKGGRKKGDE